MDLVLLSLERYYSSFDYNSIDKSHKLIIHKYLMKVQKQVFIVLLSFSSSLGLAPKVSDQTECLPLNYETYIARPTLIDLLSLNFIHS